MTADNSLSAAEQSATTLAIALAASFGALALALAALEAEARRGRPIGAAWLIYLPLIMPQVAFLPGLQVMALHLGAKGSAATVAAAHLIFVLPYVWLLLLNAVEAEQLSAALGVTLQDLPVPHVLVTRGADGAIWYDLEAGAQIAIPAFKVSAVDTTGAGDTFAGYLTAALSEGLPHAAAMRLASAASALKVTRAGTADAIPTRAEVDAFLRDQPSE